MMNASTLIHPDLIKLLPDGSVLIVVLVIILALFVLIVWMIKTFITALEKAQGRSDARLENAETQFTNSLSEFSSAIRDLRIGLDAVNATAQKSDQKLEDLSKLAYTIFGQTIGGNTANNDNG